MGTDEIHALVAAQLGSAGQRYTAKRRAIIETLLVAERPLTVMALREASPRLPLSSVYRNLAVLEQVRAVRKVVSSDDHARFELSEDLTDDHHHHLVCTGCGVVEDFTVPSELEKSLVVRLAQVARNRGFQGVEHRLDLVGVCGDCA